MNVETFPAEKFASREGFWVKLSVSGFRGLPFCTLRFGDFEDQAAVLGIQLRAV